MWVDSYEVCTFLKISEKTLQRLRVSGTIAYSNIRGRYFYKVSEIRRMLEERLIRSNKENIDNLITNHQLYAKEEEILERTSNGLAVFKHYLPGNWRIGRNFLNPLYEDSKASCNIYFDRRGGIYKMKDFGNDSYSGDCFFLVGQLKGLDCNRAADFVEILEIIDQDWGLGLASGTPVSVSPVTVRRAVPDKPKKHRKARQALPVPGTEVPACRTGVLATVRHHAELLEHYKVCSLREYNSETAEGKPYTYTSSVAEPMYGYKGKQHIKLYRPFSTPFLYGGSFGENYCFGLEQLPAKGDPLFITGGEKDVLSLAAHGFHAICFNSETVTIPPTLVYRLTFRFKHIVLLFDMDKTGGKAPQTGKTTGRIWRETPATASRTEREKDISDYFKAREHP